jgi:hypothetical protein
MNLSRLVAGNEKFLTLLLGALAVFVQDTTRISDPAIQTLIVALLVAAQGWLTGNTKGSTL